MAKKKVGFFLFGLDSGGTENYLLRFINFYHNEIEATVYCKSGKLGDLEPEYIKAGARLIPVKLGYFSLRQLWKLKEELEEKKFDAVCDLTGSFGALPLMAAKFANIKTRIGFFRNAQEKFKKTFFKTQYNNFITALLPAVATKVLSNSQTALNHFYGKRWELNDHFEVIYNGIDASSFLSETSCLRKDLQIPDSDFVVGHVGRYNEQKNHLVAMQVAVELCRNYSDIYFIFCGKGVDEVYQPLINEKGLQDRILLLGMRRDINRVLNTLDCFYFPSTIEGQPNALIEALMVGLPFVASDIEPIKETIPPEYYHQLVDPMDKLGAIERILEIKNNPLHRDALNLSDWSIDYYHPEKWFHRFRNLLIGE